MRFRCGGYPWAAMLLLLWSSGSTADRQKRQTSQQQPPNYNIYVRPVPTTGGNQPGANSSPVQFTSHQYNPVPNSHHQQQQAVRVQHPQQQFQHSHQFQQHPQQQQPQHTSAQQAVPVNQPYPGVQYSVRTNVQPQSQVQPFQVSPQQQQQQPQQNYAPQTYTQFQGQPNFQVQPQQGYQPQPNYQIQPQPNYQSQGGFPQQQSPPQGYQPQSQPSLPNNNNNNQQYIYVGGQQIPYRPQPPQSQLAPPPPAVLASQHSSGAQGISSPTSSDVIRQGKVVGSAQPPAQVIQKAPASEIEFDKGSSAKDKDSNKDDEYVIYYYYYYDEDNPGKNLTLNFDDIPNLEAYDKAKGGPQKDKARVGSSPGKVVQNAVPETQGRAIAAQQPIPAAATFAGSNAFPGAGHSHQQQPAPSGFFPGPTNAPRSATAISVSVSVSDGVPSPVPPLGSAGGYRLNGDRLPATPNFLEVQPPSQLNPLPAGLAYNREPTPNPGLPILSTPGIPVGTALPADSQAHVDSHAAKAHTDDLNEINGKRGKVIEDGQASSKDETTELETTTEVTTTEPTTTTTDRSKRLFGNRRRPGTGGGPAPPRRVTTTSSTTTTTEAPSTPRSVARGRTRPDLSAGSRRGLSGSNRLRPSFTSTRLSASSTTQSPAEEDKETYITSVPSSTSTAGTGRRFGSSGSSRVYNPSRTNSVASGRAGNERASPRTPASRTTTTTTTASTPARRLGRPTPSTSATSSTRPASGGLFSRTRERPAGRGLRPSFTRGRGVSKEEKNEEEVTTLPPTEETASLSTAPPSRSPPSSASTELSTTASTPSEPSSKATDPDTDADPEDGDDTEATKESVATTTEKSRLSGLFASRRGRPNPLAARPRPGNARLNRPRSR